MTGFDAEATAALLLRARRGVRSSLDVLPGAAHPRTLAEGVAAQVAMARLAGARSPEARVAGFKIGATTERMQTYLGLEGPAAGFMVAAGLHGSGSTLAWDGFFRPGVECELAVVLGRDLPPGCCTEAAARAAVDEVLPAIEVVENRYADLAAFGAPAMVADQVFHAAAVLGKAVTDWREIDLPAVRGTMRVDGAVVGEGEGRELLGGPFAALAWLAGSAEAAAFGGLRAGQVVMLGSVCPPVWLDRPGRITVEFSSLGHAEIVLAG